MKKAAEAIVAERLGKRYWLRGPSEQPTLFAAVRNRITGRRPKEFWALREVDFTIRKGMTVGVIGPNGSGKSSTLGLVAGTITPTEGSVRTEGRISSLLELGAGFHSELTGRENVYMNAALLGIGRGDVEKRFEAIVDFAGLGDFIDMPVKNYSSGMYVRLGFAVATEVDPDILLIDEVLAVGDKQFQERCLLRVQEFQRRGKTLLFVSHDLGTVETFCDEVLLIQGGRLTMRGDPAEVVRAYNEDFGAEHEEETQVATDEHGTGDVQLRSLRMIDATGRTTKYFACGEALEVEIDYLAKKRIEKPVFGFSVKHQAGLHIYGTNSQAQLYEIPFIEGEGTVRFRIPRLDLRRGHYFLSIAIHSWDHRTQYHRREDWYDFAVRNRDSSEGMFDLRPEFDL